MPTLVLAEFEEAAGWWIKIAGGRGGVVWKIGWAIMPCRSSFGLYADGVLNYMYLNYMYL